MFKGIVSGLFAATTVVAVLGVPANAAEEIESRLQVCSTCHGQNGVPIANNIPIIWGQQQSYLVKQLHDYKSHDRDNPIMSPMAATIMQQDIRKVAAYFAGKPWPARATPAAAASPPNGIAVCRACHQPNFEGGPPAPRLAGLSYEYLLGAMNAFADDERTNNLDMPKLMKALTPADRESIARYLSSL